MSDLAFKLSQVEGNPDIAVNLIKIRALAVLWKTCTPNVIRSIIDQNPFLLNRAHIRKLSSDNKANIQDAQELIKTFILQEKNKQVQHWTLRDDTPLHVAIRELNSEVMYRTVKLLITCGAKVYFEDAFRSPLRVLFGDKDMACETLRFILENDKNAVAALKRDINDHILDNLMKNRKFPQRVFDKMKLFLEFGVEIDELFLKYNMKSLNENKFYGAKIIKLVIQYLVINRLKKNESKMKIYVSAEKYDKILHSGCFFSSEVYEELVEYRNSLIRELYDMMNDKLDENTSLFSFIADRCSTTGTCVENEEALVCKVLSKICCKPYVCCDDLLHASIRPNAMLSNLNKLHIFAIKPSKEKIILNSDIIPYISLYLAKSDIINLTLVFWTENQTNQSKMRCLSTEASGHSEVNLSTKDSVHSNPIFPATKRMKIE